MNTSFRLRVLSFQIQFVAIIQNTGSLSKIAADSDDSTLPVQCYCQCSGSLPVQWQPASECQWHCRCTGRRSTRIPSLHSGPLASLGALSLRDSELLGCESSLEAAPALRLAGWQSAMKLPSQPQVHARGDMHTGRMLRSRTYPESSKSTANTCRTYR